MMRSSSSVAVTFIDCEVDGGRSGAPRDCGSSPGAHACHDEMLLVCTAECDGGDGEKRSGRERGGDDVVACLLEIRPIVVLAAALRSDAGTTLESGGGGWWG